MNDIKEFIVDNFLFGNEDELNENTSLFEKGIIDSTGVLELVSFIEENYDISINDEELVQDNFLSISAINNFLQKKLNNK